MLRLLDVLQRKSKSLECCNSYYHAVGLWSVFVMVAMGGSVGRLSPDHCRKYAIAAKKRRSMHCWKFGRFWMAPQGIQWLPVIEVCRFGGTQKARDMGTQKSMNFV